MTKKIYAKDNSLLSFVGKLLIIAAAIVVIVSFASKNDSAIITNPNITIEFDEIAELAVEKYSVSGVASYDDYRTIFGLDIPLTHKNFIVSYVADVKVGISDVSQINAEIDTLKNTVYVTVPEVEILDASIDPDNMVLLDETHNVLNQISVDDVIEFTDSQIEVARNTAIEQGVIPIAQDRAGEILTSHITNVLANTEYSDYEIVITVENNIKDAEEAR